MKKILFYGLMLVAMIASISAGFTSCSKDDDGGKREYIGSWHGIYDFVFEKNGTVTVELGNETCSGKLNFERSAKGDEEYISKYFFTGSGFSKSSKGNDVTHFNNSWFIGVRNENEIYIVIRRGTTIESTIWYGQNHIRK